MSPLWHLFFARIREFFREPSALFWTYGFPILLALALGLAFRGGAVKPVSIAVIDGPFGAERAATLSSNPGLIVKVISPDQAGQLFLGGGVLLEVGGDEKLEYRFDPTHPDALGARRLVDELLQQAAGRIDPLETENHLVEARGSRYIDFLIPGLIGMNIVSSSMWGIGYNIVEARKRRVLKRLAATPMKRGDYLLSFILARMVFLLSEVIILLAFAVFFFDVQIQGSIFWLGAVIIAGSMAFAGLAMVVASRTNSTETVSGLMNLVMLPMWVLSGVFFASSHFPDWLQPLIKILPLTILLDAMRAIINEGAGTVAIIGPFALMAAGAVILLTLAVKFFKWV